MNVPIWQIHGLCRGYPHDWFFPRTGERRVTLEAKALCGRCPVRRECLDFAMTDPCARHHGIWAGTTPLDRKRQRLAA